MQFVTTPLSRLDPVRRAHLARLPRSLVILLENILAHEAQVVASVDHFDSWLESGTSDAELAFRPSRILMQDTAGVAALADLAALRDYAVAQGFGPEAVDAAIPIDLVIDHSVRVDHSGTADAAALNLALEYARNDERYRFFKWAEQAFEKLRVVPPGQGICHQINLEMLTNGTQAVPEKPEWRMAETVIGTDSHTTMVNALGVLGWGVGGIEAELAALGAPVPISLPQVCEVRLEGQRQTGVTATDIALYVTSILRARGVVDSIIEWTGDGLDDLSLPDRAAIANMCPEYGATAALFPVDEATLSYLAAMGRTPNAVETYRVYAMATGLWRDAGPERRYTRSITIALDGAVPVMAGPHRPQQVRALAEVPASLGETFPDVVPPENRLSPGDGMIAIAAITSCTNTANPDLMIAAGLVARNAVARGLRVPAWVKTSLAPGSRRIAQTLERAGLQASLDALGFNVIGFGCTTCVGNSGALKPACSQGDGPSARVLCAVLSGNRNFENRIHPSVQANYLASPPLVVAAALAGNLFTDLSRDPLGQGADGMPVYLRDIWPSAQEIAQVQSELAHAAPLLSPGDRTAWDSLPAQSAARFAWDAQSTFICQPPFFRQAARRLDDDIVAARALLVLGDNVTTDHISPIGPIQPTSAAAAFLRAAGAPEDGFGSYGDRRANHDVMLRGTFDNARLDNDLADRAGNVTVGPDGMAVSIFDAAMAYADAAVPVVIFAGENYGTGSARDWAAKGTALLGIRAVIARSFERIHRANLIALGVLPVLLQGEVPPVQSRDRISLRGIAGLSGGQRRLVLEILREGATVPERHDVVADVRSDSQLAMLRSGGLFATFRDRFAA